MAHVLLRHGSGNGTGRNRVIFETYGDQGEHPDKYNGAQDGYEADISKGDETAGQDENPEDEAEAKGHAETPDDEAKTPDKVHAADKEVRAQDVEEVHATEVSEVAGAEIAEVEKLPFSPSSASATSPSRARRKSSSALSISGRRSRYYGTMR